MSLGIDVSRYNGTIDWNKVKSAGVKFAILKTVSTNYSEFGGLYIDPAFERNYAECKRLGIPVGVYYFTYATLSSTTQKELSLLKKALAGKTFEYPIYIDVEADSVTKKGKTVLTDRIIEALETIESWGYYAGYYTYRSFASKYIELDRLKAYDCWIADYGTNKGVKPYPKSKFTGPHGIWQYTSTGKVNGIKGNVDMNESYKDYPAIIKRAGLNGFGKTEAVKKTVDELAKEVIADKWGRGDERREALTKAGYNYSEVQARVNELLKKKSVDELAKEVIAGKWGNGAEREARLEAEGYDYDAVQDRVNELL